MNDLSPAFAAESLLTTNRKYYLNELRERLESTDCYKKQLGLITEMEEKYNNLEEGILLSDKSASTTTIRQNKCT
jgi:hypothetical protein